MEEFVIMFGGLFAILGVLFVVTRLSEIRPKTSALVKTSTATEEELLQMIPDKLAQATEARDSSGSMKPEMPPRTNAKPSVLRFLPIAFYIIACLGFSGWIIIALNLGSWEAFGYAIGSTIACLGSGRVIELLQIIADELQQKRLSESP